MNIAIVLCSLFLAILLSGAQALFKLFSASQNPSGEFHLLYYAPLFGALCLYFLVFLIYARALQKFELSLLYPSYTALSILLTYLTGVWLFREQASFRAGVGCVLLIVAIYLIATSNTG